MWISLTSRIGKRTCSSVVRDTIFGLSTKEGKAGIGVIRISGPNADDCIRLMTGLSDLPTARKLEYTKIYRPHSGHLLDKAMVVRFPGPHSFTGENTCEFQLHGSRAVIRDAIAALAIIPGFRLAQPGEFTRRAFEHGKLTVGQVEALADLLDAETEIQRKLALREMEGNSGLIYRKWRQDLVQAVAQLTAFIDFGEADKLEGNILENADREMTDFTPKLTVLALVKRVQSEMENEIREQYDRGQRIREGIRMTIFGKPNAGKSSFINLMCSEEVAMVSEEAGTTRDIVERTLIVGGAKVSIADTAGIRYNTSSSIETKGVQKAIQRIEDSDIIILIVDGSGPDWKETIDELSLTIIPKHVDPIVILNKSDLNDRNPSLSQQTENKNILPLSCSTKAGYSQVLQVVKERVSHLTDLGEEACGWSGLIRDRQKRELAAVHEHLVQFKEAVRIDLVIGAMELQQAMNIIGRLTEQIVDSEEVLDNLFSKFCIGK